jgi:hypothetical protein
MWSVRLASHDSSRSRSENDSNRSNEHGCFKVRHLRPASTMQASSQPHLPPCYSASLLLAPAFTRWPLAAPEEQEEEEEDEDEG